jgi:small neutral amino acid transporter SnatA (MarC family)
MTQTTTTGLPQMLAFIVTILIFLGFGIYIVASTNKVGKLSGSQVIKILISFWFLLFVAWGIEGYVNGTSFIESGLRPFGFTLRLLPILLKAL